MFKRRTSRVRQRRQVKVLRASVMSPRIFWHDFRRAVFSLIRYTLLAALIVAAGWGIWLGVQKGLLKNDEFRIQHLVLNDNPAIDEIRLLEVTGIDLSGSLFDCDPDKIRASLVALPEISNASVTREFPGDLVIRVKAREPFLWIACEQLGVPPRGRDRGLMIDRAGRLFPCPEGDFDSALDLPVMELRNGGEALVPGEKLVNTDFDRLLRLYRVAEEMLPEASGWIDSIRLHKDWGCVLTTRDGIEATFGHGDLERQMGDLLAAMEHAREKGDRIATIVLVGRRNQPVTFHEVAPPRAIPVEEAQLQPEPESAGQADLRQLLER
ncbi:hypothetical protein HAHE_09460 [Haloferula helveola]|uniref:POTRA domain-containing protein n=1 Tax=Haloferula helveola TaxID=490095 RepID=A0ABM7RJ54_9BACT|nr:hypothetical protein HAHE_09460 [Haloferula helveola]